MKKKAGYTIVEGLASMLIVSIVGLSAMRLAGAYSKSIFERDKQIGAFWSNFSVIERLKAEIKTLSQLHAFSQLHDIKIVAIGIGEISLEETENGLEMSVKSNENYGFSDKLKSGRIHLFRIEVGGDLPNTRLVTILRLEDGSGG